MLTKHVLITGASSGIGAACALHLARLGYRGLVGNCAGSILPVRWFVWRSIDDYFRDGFTTQTRQSDNLNHTEL